MQEYTIKLKIKEEIAENTWIFTFEKPIDFQFQAGQYIFMEILEKRFSDERPNFRAFSIASAPQDDFLNFIMRASESAFKKNIVAMEVGEEIKIKGPIGNFFLPKEENEEIVFLVAGVGITPIRSILRQENYFQSKRKITLFYSNRNLKSASLYQEMADFTLKNYRCINTITQDCSGWNGECGRIDEKLLNKYLDDVKKSLYYVVGTKEFIKAMENVLLSIGIEKEKIIFDNFG
jgi:ferredoxin-NADP reductase